MGDRTYVFHFVDHIGNCVGVNQGLISTMGLIAGQTELRDKNDLLGSKLAAILECRFLGNIYRVTAKYYRNSSYSYIPWLFPFSCAQQHLRSRSARPLGRNHSSSALFTPMPR